MTSSVRRSTLLVLLVLGSLTIGSAIPTASAQAPVGMKPALTIVRVGPSIKPSFVPPLPQSRPGVAPAAATINVTYSGFTNESRAAFQYAVDIWSAQITSPIPIEVSAIWRPLDEDVLGSARPTLVYRNFSPNARANTFYPLALANKLTGRDINPDESDIEASFNSTFDDWYFGTDGNTPPGMYDFVSVVLHEIGHGLGFSGSMRVSGSQGAWGFGSGTLYPSIYDAFTENGSGTPLLDTSAFPNPSNALARQLTSNNIFWDGPNARSANGGTPPKLYAPSFWQQGSSYSHLDESTYGAGNPNSLMTPQIGGGEAIHDPGAITRGLFTDIGWTIQAPQQAPLQGTLVLDDGAAYTRDAQVAARISNSSSAAATDYALSDGAEPTGSSGSFSNPAQTVQFNLDTSDGQCRTHTVYGRLYDARGPSATFSDAIIYDPSVEGTLTVKGPEAPDPAYTRTTLVQINYQAAPNECSGLNAMTITYTAVPSGVSIPAPRTVSLTGTSGTVGEILPSTVQGTYTFRLQLSDKAGNTRSFGSYTITYDRTAPTAALGATDTAPTQENRDGVVVLNLQNLVVNDNIYRVPGAGGNRQYWGYRIVVKRANAGLPTEAEWDNRGITAEGRPTSLKWNIALGLVGDFTSGGNYIVYMRFLDGAGNQSEDIIMSERVPVNVLQGPRLFLPLVRR